jgi:hypothetical protein
MFEFVFGSKKKAIAPKPVEDPDSIVVPKEVVVAPSAPPIVTKAFFFKFLVNYYGPKEVSQYTWSSGAYFDYQKAVDASRNIIKNIMIQLNEAEKDEYIFIIDLSIKKRKIIDATANDVQLVTFENGKAVKSECIIVAEGENVILPALDPNTYNVIRG